MNAMKGKYLGSRNPCRVDRCRCTTSIGRADTDVHLGARYFADCCAHAKSRHDRCGIDILFFIFSFSFFFFYLIPDESRGNIVERSQLSQFLRNREFDSQTDSNILHRSSPRVSRIINSFPWPSNYISPCYVIRIESPICTCVVKSIVTRSRNIFHAEKSKERSIFLLFAFTIKRTNTADR